MPRVVIELQANTQQAVAQIQQFAKAQRDAFDAIRAATPALEDARIKVSTLTDAYGGLAKAQADLGRQGPPAAASIQTITKAMTDARGAVIAYGTATSEQKAATSRFMDELKAGAEKSTVAMTGFRSVTKNLITEIPLVGGPLSHLANTMGTFPLLIGGIVGAGVALIKMLQDISAETSKTLSNIEAMSAGIQASLTATIHQVNQLRAQQAGNLPGAAQAGAAGELAAAQEARDAALRAAQKKFEETKPAFFSPAELGIKESLAATERRNAELAAEAEFQLKAMTIRTKLAGDLAKLDADRVKDYEANREKEVAATEAAATKEKAIWTQTTQDAIAIFQELGAGFEEALKPLQLEQFVEKTQAQLAVLNTAIDQGRDTHGQYAKAIEVLTTKMNEAITLGYVPMTTATKTATAAMNESAAAVESLAEKYKELAAAQQEAANELKMAAHRPPPAAPTAGVYDPTVGGYVGSTGIYNYPGAAADLAQEAYTQAVQLTNIMSTPIEFQHGGLVPGVGPRAIIAHGGERILPVHGECGGEAVKVHIEPGAVQLSGTIIDQQRGWGTLVEELGQALETRLARRGR
jgi:hypothetical protein